MKPILFLTKSFIFRNPVFGVERKEFKCNTIEFGCENICFNTFQPISAHRFWGFQALVTSIPMLVYITLSMHINCKKKRIELKRLNLSSEEVKLKKLQNARTLIAVINIYFDFIWRGCCLRPGLDLKSHLHLEHSVN